MQYLMSRLVVIVVLFSIIAPTLAEETNSSHHSLSHGSADLIDIEKVTSNLYIIKTYKEVQPLADKPPIKMDANAFIYVDNGDAYLIDTPWNESDMPNLMSWLELKGLNLKATLITHFHPDSSAGLVYLNENGFVTYASDMTNDLLLKDNQSATNRSFSGENFTLLKGKVEVYYPGSGHTTDNLVVWLPHEEILIGGCILRAIETDSLGWTGDADLDGWYNSVVKLKEKYPQVKLVFPGHGNSANGQLMIDHTLTLSK